MSRKPRTALTCRPSGARMLAGTPKKARKIRLEPSTSSQSGARTEVRKDMPLTLTATWRAREGEEAEVERILRTMVPLTLQEPGCLTYIALRSDEDPREFLLFEQYQDKAALDAHQASDHFQRHVLGDAIPRLANRVRRFYSVL